MTDRTSDGMNDGKTDRLLVPPPEQVTSNATTVSASTVAEFLARSPLPAIDTRVLLCHALGWRRTELITRSDQTLTSPQIDVCQALIARRFAGEPVAQLVGTREFFGRDFIVTSAVLIPRPDTELLVELALEAIDARVASMNAAPKPPGPANAMLSASLPAAAITVLDLGTGSGAIAVTLAAERPLISVIATDRSGEALQVAQRNAQVLLGDMGKGEGKDTGKTKEESDASAFTHYPLLVADRQRIAFAQGDWFAALDPLPKEDQAKDPAADSADAPIKTDLRFDVVVSNPPYIAAHDPHLLSGDLRFEPAGALSDGGDGLSDLRAIADSAGAWLKPTGQLLLEHGYDQGSAVRQILATAGFTAIRTMHDLAGHERVTLGSWAA